MARQTLPQNDKGITIGEFIVNLQYLDVALLKDCMELPEFIAHTIFKNLCMLEETQRPIICVNPQLRRFHYKDGEWKLGTDFIKPSYCAIHRNAFKQVMENYCDGYLCMEKQRILLTLCNVEKYPSDKCCEKALNKLGKLMRSYENGNETTDFQIVGDDSDVSL